MAGLPGFEPGNGAHQKPLPYRLSDRFLQRRLQQRFLKTRENGAEGET